jgi:hypothetical protein
MTDYDASNKKHIKIAEREARAMDDTRAGFISHIMGLVDGRTYIHDLLTACHIFRQPFSPNAQVTAFACGELNIGQRLLSDIMRFCPDDYIVMMREANARKSTSDARRGRSDKDAGGPDSGSIPIYVHPGYRDDSAADPGSQAADYNPVDRDEGGE